ncbi:alpha/beta hydrolase [Actinomycetospora straminea]|uniref:Alpha/beta hydrolase fold-3 domain-containing protein n=1 Tax=Actinomycetospora straminea TaxID=663607 RepID=A0ABP9DZE1_9PSEU|nr:alpha/beta hydrolase [Actinomycetospora straminea]MDD7932319.1 alpha/beta hydrolase [Actinomycetospora straminea]
MLVWLVRVVAVVWLLGVLVVAVGTYAPRLPVIGFLGSFVTGQYPLHAALAALTGVGLGVLARALGARTDGAVVAGVALVAAVALVGVLVTQVRASGTRIDWWQALTVTGQPDGRPDRTEPYAADELGRPLLLDLYRPAGPGPHPVVVWVHGGSWVRGERTDRTALCRWLADRGHAVVAVQYRLPPPAPVGEGQRRDVAAAAAWAAEHAGEEDLDPGRLVIAGQSAGATLALSTTAGILAGELAAPRPRAVVAYYPVTDLRAVDRSLQDAVLGGRAADDVAATRASSPAALVRPDLPPTLLVLGSADHFVFPDRVHAYDRDLRAAGVPGRLVEVPHADHVFDFPFGSPGAQATRPPVLAFLAEHVGTRTS